MAHQRPFRFGVQIATSGSGKEWQEKARKAETLGYDTLVIPDHIGGRLAYEPALMAAAVATTTRGWGSRILS